MKSKATKPTIRVQAGAAVAALQAFQKLAAANFPAMEAFRIGLAIATLSGDRNVGATDRTRVAMLKKHSVEKDGTLSVPPDKLASFVAEFAPVADAWLEIDLAPLPLAMLEHAPPMTPMEMIVLKPFFTGE